MTHVPAEGVAVRCPSCKRVRIWAVFSADGAGVPTRQILLTVYAATEWDGDTLRITGDPKLDRVDELSQRFVTSGKAAWYRCTCGERFDAVRQVQFALTAPRRRRKL
jgi:hypothetical protein